MAQRNVTRPFGVHSEVGQLRKVHGLRAGPGPPAPDADQLRRAAVRRRAVGRERQARPFRLRARRCASAASRSSRCTTCWPRRWPIPEAQEVGARPAGRRPTRSGLGLVDEIRELPRGPGSARARRDDDRRPVDRRVPRDPRRRDARRWSREAAGVTEYLLPPLPNTLYTRDTTCWIYGGVTLNPLYWPARHEETLLRRRSTGSTGLRRQGQGLVGRSRRGPWPGDARGRRRHADRQRQRADRHERAHLAPGASARSPRRCSSRARPSASSSPRCPSCGPRCTSTPCSPSPTATACCSIPTSSTTSTPSRYRPARHAERRGAAARTRSRSSTSSPTRSGVKKLRVVETGGDAYMRERTQWDSGANLVCASPGVVFAYDRNTYANTLLRKAGHRGDHDRRRRARPRPRRRPLHDLPDHPRSGRFLRP